MKRMLKEKDRKLIWIEKHPFWMAVIVSVFVSIYAITFHASHTNPKDFQTVFMWLPLLWFLVFIIPILNWGCEKLLK